MNTYEAIADIITHIKPGVFTRISYESDLPVKACYKNEGVRVLKICDITVRTGINYRHIKSNVDNHTGKMSSTRSNNIHYEVRNRILLNNDNGKRYFTVYPTKKGCNEKCDYILMSGNEVKHCDEADVKEFVIDSYWRKPRNPVFMINFDNIRRIGKFTFNN